MQSVIELGGVQAAIASSRREILASGKQNSTKAAMIYLREVY